MQNKKYIVLIRFFKRKRGCLFYFISYAVLKNGCIKFSYSEKRSQAKVYTRFSYALNLLKKLDLIPFLTVKLVAL